LDAKLIGMPPYRVHDLRRTAATGMGELGVSDEVIGRVLGHAGQGVTRAVYNRSGKVAECRAALEAWSAHLAKVVGDASLTAGWRSATGTPEMRVGDGPADCGKVL
jgi:hypothetical protein